ncbi:hypothetical protein FRC12_014671 [Ceratobasidium sp. 428]|nr:hypothetical protein FRC12_014671 [Ceratobasidium sp. 428]
MPPPTAHTNAGNAKPSGWRTVRNATKLIVARYVAKVATTPGIKGFNQTLRSVVADLEPTLLQAPKANNELVKQELARMEEIKEDVVRLGEEIKDLDDTDSDIAIARLQRELHGMSDPEIAPAQLLAELGEKPYGATAAVVSEQVRKPRQDKPAAVRIQAAARRSLESSRCEYPKHETRLSVLTVINSLRFREGVCMWRSQDILLQSGKEAAGAVFGKHKRLSVVQALWLN